MMEFLRRLFGLRSNSRSETDSPSGIASLATMQLQAELEHLLTAGYERDPVIRARGPSLSNPLQVAWFAADTAKCVDDFIDSRQVWRHQASEAKSACREKILAWCAKHGTSQELVFRCYAKLVEAYPLHKIATGDSDEAEKVAAWAKLFEWKKRLPADLDEENVLLKLRDTVVPGFLNANTEALYNKYYS